MTDAIRWVGLDVHATQTTVAVVDKATGELQRAKLRGSPSVVLDFIAGYDGRVVAVYEAGPTGMSLARQARAAGIDMRVCAPGLIPRKATDRIKTDARDAEILARQLAAGALSFVRVPTVQEESLRDLVRAREDVVKTSRGRVIGSASSCCAAICATPRAARGRRSICTGSPSRPSTIGLRR